MYGDFNIPFWVNTRIDAVTEDKLMMLKDAGCYRLSFSLEHGNEEFRKRILKRSYKNEMLLECMCILSKCGVTSAKAGVQKGYS